MSTETRNADKMLKEDSNKLFLINDPDFVADLERLSFSMPVLQEALKAAKDQAQKYLGNVVDRLSQTLLMSICSGIPAKKKSKREKFRNNPEAQTYCRG